MYSQKLDNIRVLEVLEMPDLGLFDVFDLQLIDFY